MEITIKSKYNEGDTIRDNKKVVKVEYNSFSKDFRYLIEYPNGERHWVYEKEL